MKDYQKILEAENRGTYRLVEHEWGQSPQSVYNQIIHAWNERLRGQKIFFLSRKTYGLKSILALLRRHDVQAKVIGKGGGDARLVEIIKTADVIRQPLESDASIAFTFRSRTYRASPGNAVFSKNDLDEGTRFLLETFLTQSAGLDRALIGDLGAGWGAIALILSAECPGAHIIAYEKEIGAYEACVHNVKNSPTIAVYHTDVGDSHDPNIQKYAGTLDCIVSNFSFHISAQDRKRFFHTARVLLKPKGKTFFVTEGRFVSRFEQAAGVYFSVTRLAEYNRYVVFAGQK